LENGVTSLGGERRSSQLTEAIIGRKAETSKGRKEVRGKHDYEPPFSPLFLLFRGGCARESEARLRISGNPKVTKRRISTFIGKSLTVEITGHRNTMRDREGGSEAVRVTSRAAGSNVPTQGSTRKERAAEGGSWRMHPYVSFGRQLKRGESMGLFKDRESFERET